jgi:hypothetical protein
MITVDVRCAGNFIAQREFCDLAERPIRIGVTESASEHRCGGNYGIRRLAKARDDSGDDMNEERLAKARADLQRRVSEFQDMQARFQREREDYYESTIRRVRSVRWNEFVTPRADNPRPR